MNKDNLTIVILIALMFTGIFYVTHAWDVSTDAIRHYYKTTTNCFGDAENIDWDNEVCSEYAPLFHWLLKPFASNFQFFNYAVLVLLIFIPALALYFFTREWLAPFLFFTITDYQYTMMIGGYYPQAFAQLLAFLILFEKRWQYDLLLVLLATISHGSGFALACLILLAKHLNKFVHSSGFKEAIELIRERGLKVFLGCSAFFGKNVPGFMGEEKRVASFYGGGQVTIGNLLVLVTKTFPIIFLPLAIKGALEKQRLDLLFIALVALVLGFTYQKRAFLMIPLVLIPCVAWAWRGLSFKWKAGTMGLFVLSGMFQIYSYFNYLRLCV